MKENPLHSKFKVPTSRAQVSRSNSDPLQYELSSMDAKAKESLLCRIVSLSIDEGHVLEVPVCRCTRRFQKKDGTIGTFANTDAYLPANEEDAAAILDDDGVPLGSREERTKWLVPVWAYGRENHSFQIVEPINQLRFIEVGWQVWKAINQTLAEDRQGIWNFDVVPNYDIRICREIGDNGKPKYEVYPAQKISVIGGAKMQDNLRNFPTCPDEDVWDFILGEEEAEKEFWGKIDDLLDRMKARRAALQTPRNVKLQFLRYRAAPVVQDMEVEELTETPVTDVPTAPAAPAKPAARVKEVPVDVEEEEEAEPDVEVDEAPPPTPTVPLSAGKRRGFARP